MTAADLHIAACPAEARTDALRLLHAGLSADQQTALVPALDEARNRGEAAFSGLLVAMESKSLAGVVWVQWTAGRTAVVWPPDSRGVAADDLMRAAAGMLDAKQISLAQVVIHPDAPVDQQLLARNGFQELAKLSYLMAERDFFPPSCPECELEYEAAASRQPKRLGPLLLETYEGTLDCPALNGIREANDILESYAAQGIFCADSWFFVRHAGRDVGTLLLAAHPDRETWELVYMGIVPKARGRGWGGHIVQFALWRAACERVERMVLAVDEANAPALAMYREAGFTTWDRRTVYIRLRSPNSSET